MDEIDAIAPIRGRGENNQVTERIVSQLLTEIDGVERLKDVILIASTNRPDIIDPALLRSGRFSKQIELGLPDAETRKKIFKIHLKGLPLATDVDIDHLVSIFEGKTGADIEALCGEVVQNAIREWVGRNDFHDLSESELHQVKIQKKHFDASIEGVLKNASRNERNYQKLEGSLQRSLYS